jgi:predicted AAA+ superfamily ATPase
MYIRKNLLNKIIAYLDKPIIKVITGMRRVGKSCFLQQVQQHMLEQGIPKDSIIVIEKESLAFDFIKDYQDLHAYIQEQSPKKYKNYYLFVDEIQEITNWEKCITSLFKDGIHDIYITGSNAHLLSSELATLLSGRYIEFPIYPLSFQEATEFGMYAGTITEQFQKYLQFGGLPGISHFLPEENQTLQYINDIYNTILLKDIVKRFNIRNTTNLQNITNFLFDNIGNLFSAKKITDYLKNQKIKLTVDTLQNYATYLRETFLIHQASRYDIKGKKILEISEKYYANDLGVRNAIIGYQPDDIAVLLENIIYIELKNRGFTVYVGKADNKEIDFIAVKREKKYYIQVSYLLGNKETQTREFEVFANSVDHYPKILLTLDLMFSGKTVNGIRCINIIDFLLDLKLLA